MAINMRRIILALICSLLLTTSSAAQEANRAELTPPDISSFPLVSCYLDVYDAQGNFIYGLEPGDISILENGRELPVVDLRQLRPGVQFVVAINPGMSFAIRDVQGNSRFDYLAAALDAWAEARQGSTLDDVSFLGKGAAEATHLKEIQVWRSNLRRYQAEAAEESGGLEVLAGAMEIAAEPTSRPEMGRAVLYVTSLPEQEDSLALESIAARANQRGVRLFVWLVTSTDLYSSPAAQHLESLAARTGGKFFTYSGVESIPDVEDYLEPLRNTYFLAHESRLRASGTYKLAAIVKRQGFETTSAEQEFEIDISPPNVAFISAPLEIKRKAPLEGDNSKITPEDYHPKIQDLELLIEFPDRRVRALERTTLYVDGIVASQNTAPPFDRLSWDLRDYQETAPHTIKVEAVDELGFRTSSMEWTVLVILEHPELNSITAITRNSTLLVTASVVLAGSVLFLVLIMAGRVRPGFLKLSRNNRRRTDPVTQPVKVKSEPARQRLPGWMNRLHWPQRRLTPHAIAYLYLLSESEQAKTAPPISITGGELTFGRDATQATQILDDPSVEELHARLRLSEDGTFRLNDEGSVAGTWVNYSPVSTEGAHLEHGDLIHIGRLGFRFVMRNPERTRKPSIIPEEPQQ